jgi:transposase
MVYNLSAKLAEEKNYFGVIVSQMTTTNQQVKLLMKNLKKHTQAIAAARAGMDVKTARKYIKNKALPSEMKQARKAKPDIFSEDWDELSEMLENAPGLEAKTLMNYLLSKKPDKYNPNQIRTLQRKVRQWRAEHGASQSVIFRQDIQPGKQSQSDHTCMNDLKITLNGRPFKHLLFHFMLPFSRWESVNLSFSESFESLVSGFEKAVWELGGTLPEHRTDNLSAATKALGNKRDFTARWQEVMSHYGVVPTTNNPGISHENGSVEKSHDTLKKAIEQGLLLRGSCDFLSQESYMGFVEAIVKQRNDYRGHRLMTEVERLQELPNEKWHSPIVIRTRVSAGSIVQILDRPYTVPSRLIHYTLIAYVYPEEIILFYNNKQLQCMPRMHDDKLAGINYRHIIDSLVRKPSAFANYRYHEALFPRLCFRKAYDLLKKSRPVSADKCYLKLLQLAKIQSEQQVSDAISLLLEENQVPTPDAVKSLIDVFKAERRQVAVDMPRLSDYDVLLSQYQTTNKEIN